MARGRRAFRKKPRRRRTRSRPADAEDEDGDYIAEVDDGDSDEESASSGDPDRGSSDEESFQFSDSDDDDDEEEVAAAPKRRTAAPMKRKRSARVPDDDGEEAVSARSFRRRSSRDLDFTVDDDDDSDEDFTPDDDELEMISPVATKKSGGGGGGRGRRMKKQAPKARSKGNTRRKPVAAAPVRKRRRAVQPLSDEDDDDFIIDDADKRRKKAGRKKAAPTKTRKRSVVDSASSDDSGDDDFILDLDKKNKKSGRKKATPRITRKRPDSESSDSDFVVSDDSFLVKDQSWGCPTINRHQKKKRSETVRKERTAPKPRKRITRSSDSSGSGFNYVVCEEEIRDLGIGVIPRWPEPRKIVVKRKGEEKGKEKETEALEKPLCGICLSEEQKGTIQGVLNCCAHYFCFTCIMEWSKVESRCPVCKRRFTTISKSARSDPGIGLRKAIIKVQKRDQVYQPSEEEIRGLLDPYENMVCMVCQQGGDDNLMLLCDICDSSAHTYCVGLGREVPEGNWYCEGCRSTGGSSNSLLQDTAIDHGTSSGDLFSGGIETEDLSTTNANITTCWSVPFPDQSSSHIIDLNVSPRHLSEEEQGVASQVSCPSVQTSGRRPTHQRIRVRLSDNRPRQNGNMFNGSSNLQVQDTAVDQGTSSGNMLSAGTETEDLNLSTQGSTNMHDKQSISFPGQSSQIIDLNLTPRNLIGENNGVSTQASGAVASTLSGRRAIHQRIRILLSSSRPRQIATSHLPRHNVESDVITSEVEQARGFLHVPEGLHPLHTVSATESFLQNGRPVLQSTSCLAPRTFNEISNFRHVDGAKEQVQSLVKRHMKNLAKGTSVVEDRETFKEIARRSTHTILAACGFEHCRRIVTTLVQPPNTCFHGSDDGPANLVEGCCPSCFNSFVKDVVQEHMNAA